MKKLWLIIVFLHSAALVAVEGWDPCPFDEGIALEQCKKEFAMTTRVLGIDALLLYDFFKDLYQQHALHGMPTEKERIPKIIHHIWLGSPVPLELKKIMKTWHKHHPGWGYRLWTDEDAAEFPLFNRELFDASTNYGQKSDILRYEILYHMGGVYVDVDTECLRSLEPLHYLFDLYVGIQPLDVGFMQLGIGVLAAAPKHPLLKKTIVSMKKNAEKTKGAPSKTGPVHFTKVFYAHAGKDGFKDVALPPVYFYPLGSYEKTLAYDTWRQAGAFTVHHWGKTWMPSEYRYGIFRKINNQDATKDWNT